MRKIVCQSCRNRWGDYGLWIVFGNVIICESCRLRAVERIREMGFGFDHPFIKELTIMEVTRNKK